MSLPFSKWNKACVWCLFRSPCWMTVEKTHPPFYVHYFILPKTYLYVQIIGEDDRCRWRYMKEKRKQKRYILVKVFSIIKLYGRNIFKIVTLLLLCQFILLEGNIIIFFWRRGQYVQFKLFCSILLSCDFASHIQRLQSWSYYTTFTSFNELFFWW